jgi:hypothetical protein
MMMGLGDPLADYSSASAVGLFVLLMCVCIVVGHLLEENQWMNESITALFIVSQSSHHQSRAAALRRCLLLLSCLIGVNLGEYNSIFALQGLGTGAVILITSSGKHSRLLVFSEELFFIYLLPPVIFNAGYIECFDFTFRNRWILLERNQERGDKLSGLIIQNIGNSLLLKCSESLRT